MALKSSLLTLSLSLTSLASPQKPEDFATYTINDPAQMSRYQSRIATFEASLTKDPKYASRMSVGETAFPATLNWDEALAPGKTLSTEGWYKALPTDLRDWWLSVASEEKKFITDTADGPAPTGGAAAGGGAPPPAGAPAGAAASASGSSAAAQASSGASAASAGASSTASARASSASASTSANANAQKAANGTAKSNGAEEQVGSVRFAQAMAVGIAGAFGAVALLL